MIIVQLILSCLILYLRVCGLEDFCSENPATFFCDQSSPTALGPDCGQTSKLKTQTFNYLQIVRDINDQRKSFAEGKASFQGVRFPEVGDVLELEWNEDLERAAQQYVKLCPESSTSPDRRVVRFMPVVSELLFSEYNSMMISERPFWEKALTSWKEDELKAMSPYTTVENPKIDMDLVVYGKQRYVGCGKTAFFQDNVGVWKSFIACFFSPGTLKTTFPKMNKKPCSECPAKTLCSSNGQYSGYLCLWNHAGKKAASNLTIISIVLILTLIFK